jgi:hypothetical protein
MARTCLFCSSTKVSREHVWPDWISPLFHKNPINRQYRMHRSGTNTPLITAWSKSLDQKARVVCVRCNNGWMSEFESASKPVLTPFILGLAAVLDDHVRAVLNAWLTLRHMIMEHTSVGKDRWFRREEHYAFANLDEDASLSPMPGGHIWIGRFDTHQQLTTSLTIQNLTLHSLPLTDGYDMQVITGIVGRLAFQSVVGRWPPDRELAPDSPDIAGWDDALVPIWPDYSDVDFTWPPRKSIGDDALEPFHNRFARGIPTRRPQ